LDEGIFATLPEVTKPGSFAVVSSPKEYLRGVPATLGNDFGVYRGSLTHPPCNRGVRWMIAKQTFRVASDKVRE
jgi:hypothetical protein